MSAVKMTNFVGLLQEICAKAKYAQPTYSDEAKYSENAFKFICSVESQVTEGQGVSKKEAKHNSAKLMIEKLDGDKIIAKKTENKIEQINKCNENAVSKLYSYTSKEKKEKPLFSDKPQEDGLYVVDCTFDGYSCTGKGSNKKIAKEMSADLILKHFDIHNYFRELSENKSKPKQFINPVQQLYDICQAYNLNTVVYHEEVVLLTDNKKSYKVTCIVGDKKTTSLEQESLERARRESATLMVNLLNVDTPVSSPPVIHSPKRSSPRKRAMTDDKTEEETNEKRVKECLE